MKEEVKKYSEWEKPDLLEAAENWRMPYWDWAMKKQLPESPGKRDYNVPLVVLDKKVHIRQPTTLGHGDCENAFYQFKMSDDITMGDSSLGNDENRLEDLRIHPGTFKENNKTYTLPVRKHQRCTRKLLTSFSTINAKLQVDTQGEKAAIKTGSTGTKIMQLLQKPSEIINGIR